MKTQSILNRYFLVLVMAAITVTGCFNEQAYRKLEDSYSPTKQVSPMSSNVRWACESNMLFEPASIKLTFASMRRLNEICSDKPHVYVIGESLRNKQWARPDLSGKTHLVEACNYPKIPIRDCQNVGGYILHVPNTDPNLGAVNVWDDGGYSLDGVLSANKITNEYKSERIHYAMYIVEGHKLPIGGMFSRLPDYMDDPTYPTVKSAFTTATGLKWKHARVNNYPKPGDTSHLYGQSEIYQADVGNYSILVQGIYDHPVYQYPDWLAKRQAFLREWIESFKIEPLPADYKSQ